MPCKDPNCQWPQCRAARGLPELNPPDPSNPFRKSPWTRPRSRDANAAIFWFCVCAGCVLVLLWLLFT